MGELLNDSCYSMREDDLPDYNNMSDSQLAAVCRDEPDNPECIDLLIKRYLPLIKSRAAKYSCDSVPAEDLASEGFLAFFKAVSAYDEGRGHSFSAYASVCVSNRMISAVRSADNSALTAEYNEEGEDLNTPEAICIERELYSEIFSILSKKERDIFRFYIDGTCYSEIASALSISVKSVDNAVQRIRKKLRMLIS